MAQHKAPVVGLTTFQRRLFYTGYAVILLIAGYYMRLSPAALSLTEEFGRLSQGGPWFIPGTKVAIRRDYTGIEAIDTVLTFYVAVFHPISTQSKGTRLQLAYFLFNFTSIWALLAVESIRARNAWALITL
jgi:hypothetical protein